MSFASFHSFPEVQPGMWCLWKHLASPLEFQVNICGFALCLAAWHGWKYVILVLIFTPTSIINNWHVTPSLCDLRIVNILTELSESYFAGDKGIVAWLEVKSHHWFLTLEQQHVGRSVNPSNTLLQNRTDMKSFVDIHASQRKFLKG